MNTPNAIGRLDRLLAPAYESPSTIRLQFADGQSFGLDVLRLELPEGRTDWSTVAVSPLGDALVVSVGGEPIPIGAGNIRYRVDKAYAAEIEAAIREVQFTREELAAFVRENPPPPEWYSPQSQDLTREGWK